MGCVSKGLLPLTFGHAVTGFKVRVGVKTSYATGHMNGDGRYWASDFTFTCYYSMVSSGKQGLVHRLELCWYDGPPRRLDSAVPFRCHIARSKLPATSSSREIRRLTASFSWPADAGWLYFGLVHGNWGAERRAFGDVFVSAVPWLACSNATCKRNQASKTSPVSLLLPWRPKR